MFLKKLTWRLFVFYHLPRESPQLKSLIYRWWTPLVYLPLATSEHLIQIGNHIPAHQFNSWRELPKIPKQNGNSGSFNFLISIKRVVSNDYLLQRHPGRPHFFPLKNAGTFPQVILRYPDGSLGWSCLGLDDESVKMNEEPSDS